MNLIGFVEEQCQPGDWNPAVNQEPSTGEPPAAF